MQIFLFFLIGLSPIVFVLAPSGIWTYIYARFQHVHALFYMLVVCMHSMCLIKCPNGIFSLFWTLMSTNFWGLLCFYMLNLFWTLAVCFTHFSPCVPCHALLMHLTCTPQAHLMHTLDHLTCFAFHSCYVSLVRPLALKNMILWLFLLVSMLFRTILFVCGLTCV